MVFYFLVTAGTIQASIYLQANSKGLLPHLEGYGFLSRNKRPS